MVLFLLVLENTYNSVKISNKLTMYIDVSSLLRTSQYIHLLLLLFPKKTQTYSQHFHFKVNLSKEHFFCKIETQELPKPAKAANQITIYHISCR